MSNVISFPGLGIDGFNVNPVAFSIFGFDIMWYGIIITCAMAVGFFVALHNAKFEKIKTDDVLDLAIFLIIFSMIGARLYYVLMKLEDYNSFLDVINVRNGGLAIYGGVIAGTITIYVVAKIKKINPAKMLDMVAPGVMIGQAIGRWGNFTNAEAHGVETKLPWRMGIMYAGSTVTKYYHPTFLYESLWCLIGFLILYVIYKKFRKFSGQLFLGYGAWYGLGRMIIEGFRTDSLYIAHTTIRVSQVVSGVLMLVCLVLYIVFTVKYTKHPKPIEGVDYFPEDAVKTKKERLADEAAAMQAQTEETSAEKSEEVSEEAPEKEPEEKIEEIPEEEKHEDSEKTE